MSLFYSSSVFRLPVLQNNNVDFEEGKPEPSLKTKESSQFEGDITDSRVKDKTDSGTSDLEDPSANSEMFRTKSQVSGSVSKGQKANQTTPSRRVVKSTSESSQTAVNESKTPSSTPTTKAKNGTAKEKVSVKSVEVETPSDKSSQKVNDKPVPLSPTTKDQNTSGPSSATGSKSKIPIRSPSGAEVRSPVAPDRAAVTHVSGTAVTLKLPKTAETKESLKQSVKEAKGEKAPARGASPTKTANKAGTKAVKEKSEVDSHSVNLVNGVVRDSVKEIAKTIHPANKESLAVKKDGQKPVDSSASSTSSSRLPVSVQTKKKSQETTEASGNNFKTTTSSKTESDRPKTVQKQSPDEPEVTPAEKIEKKKPPTLPESPKNGKQTCYISRHYNMITSCKRENCQNASFWLEVAHLLKEYFVM